MVNTNSPVHTLTFEDPDTEEETVWFVTLLSNEQLINAEFLAAEVVRSPSGPRARTSTRAQNSPRQWTASCGTSFSTPEPSHGPRRLILGLAPLNKVPGPPTLTAQVELLAHVPEPAIPVHSPGEHPPLHPRHPLPAHLRQSLVPLPGLQVVAWPASDRGHLPDPLLQKRRRRCPHHACAPPPDVCRLPHIHLPRRVFQLVQPCLEAPCVRVPLLSDPPPLFHWQEVSVAVGHCIAVHFEVPWPATPVAPSLARSLACGRVSSTDGCPREQPSFSSQNRQGARRKRKAVAYTMQRKRRSSHSW